MTPVALPEADRERVQAGGGREAGLLHQRAVCRARRGLLCRGQGWISRQDCQLIDLCHANTT